MRDLLRSLSLGTNVSAILIAIATFGILYFLGIENWLGLSFSVISGLAAGVIIGQATEYYTSHSYKPTQKISEAGQTGAATVIIKGIGTGMISTCIPVITIGVAILLSYMCANGFDLSMSSESLSHGLYGIGIAAVGMLSTLGITLATDAYGPIADNAGGNAEMSQLGEEVRHRTDALDALGNTTAATGKGFAIGSAALTALALLASYIEEIKIAMVRADVMMENVKGELISATQANIPDFMNYFQVNLMNPKVLVGAFIGAMAAFLFCGMTMEAVGRAAEKMVQEVRRQFKEIAGILEGTGTPDYGRCVEISTRAAQHEMIIPSVLAIIIPIIVGCVLGVAGVLGLLVGGLAGGFTLAVFMAIDYITGVMCAAADHKLSSEVGFKGICRKVLIFALVGIGHVLDTQVIGTGSILRTAVIFFYLFNEGVSLVENAAHLGLPIPEKLKAVLEQLHDRAEKGGDE